MGLMKSTKGIMPWVIKDYWYESGKAVLRKKGSIFCMI